ncbi:MAG: nuclear transport factor 2 family protein [Acidimicrobiaceae bacterium]|nr:nuclear transport factor 2 family protein [Acidimicrobiaceae bacterium]MYD06876.1 nuclear transport factor 2 family protein [Acidimicrobiaceae bacterium]MYI58413.1 nuclear transport factor 2 family protein [Acidimicrobiaceae bacterium]
MARLTDLHDRAELADLTALYAVIVDQRDFARFDEVFTADALLDTGRGQRSGLAEITDAMAGLLRYEATSHILGQQLFSVTDDAGIEGVTYCEAHHLRVDGDERIDHVMHIHYHDRFVTTPDGWRIAYRRLVVPWTADYPV